MTDARGPHDTIPRPSGADTGRDAVAPLEVRWTDAAGAHSVRLAGRLVVGSGAGVDVTVADPSVSRLHAEFEARDDGVWVRDLGSRNGTTLDGFALGAARLLPGATVRVGGTALVVAAAAEKVAPRDDADPPLWPGERFGPLVGRSDVMRALFAQLARVAATGATVLLQGETGTGKELAARAVHDASPRRGGPFIVVDCAALPENLLEAELFGHARGAFTGAVGARAGAFEAAEGGTLFLDEIGELPLAMQPKLLRALEARTVRRLGETEHRPIDVRFVSATHRDLRALVNQGAFREDLYFRLAVVPVTIPPLRARPEDIPLLVERFLPPGADAPALSATVERELASRPWLGNARELRNFVERAVALGPRYALASTPAAAAAAPPVVVAGPRAGAPAGPGDVVNLRVDLARPFKDVRDAWTDVLERAYLAAMIARHGGNITAAAQASGLDRSHVYRLIKKHAL